MTDIYFDTETRSGLDIKTVGAKRHINDSDADIICMAYRVGMEGKTQLWINGSPAPQEFTQTDKHNFHAFNMGFDMEVINVLGPKHGFSKLPLRNCYDVQALVARFGFPQSLKKAGDALGITEGKQDLPPRVMTKIVLPPWDFTADEFNQFLYYCIGDVDAMCAIIEALPSQKLSQIEQEIWWNTTKINNYGIPVDVSSAIRIHTIVENYKQEQLSIVPELTEGNINTIGQRDKILAWIGTKGGELPDYKKATIRNILVEKPEWMTPNIRKLFELKITYGQTSTKKLQTLANQAYEGRLYNNLRYFGGHTGRESGNAFQIHSLPRDAPEDIEKELNKFRDLSILDGDNSPMDSAKSLIRSMIFSTPETRLAVLDYSSIEYRVMHWLVKNYDELAEVAKGSDRYVYFASLLYKIPEEEVTKKQRNFGKTVVLGAQYCLGVPTLLQQCKERKIDVTEDEVRDALRLFKTLFPKIVRFWNDLNQNCLNAMRYEGEVYDSNGCAYQTQRDHTGRLWLTLLIPSDRCIFYCEPLIEKGDWGPIVTHMGVHPQSKKWVRRDYRTTRMVENIAQALARDILMDGRVRVSSCYDVIASVHDENIVEVPEKHRWEHWDVIKKLMEVSPSWCKDLPLAVTGFCERRYRKD